MQQDFHLLRVAHQDQYKNPLSICTGQSKFNGMPFGLSGGPPTFKQVVNNILFDYFGRRAIVYLDDVLLQRADIHSCVVLFTDVLSIPTQPTMYPRLYYFHSAVDSTNYLRCITSEQGIQPNPQKVDVVCVWPKVLENATEAKQFLANIRYFRMCMGEEFTDIAEPVFQ